MPAENKKLSKELIEQSFSLTDITENILYYRKFFLMIFGVIFSLTIVYALMATPIYTADVLIQVESKKGGGVASVLSNKSDGGGLELFSSSPIAGEIEIFKSRNVMGRAIENEFLNTSVQVDNRFPLVGGLLSRVLPTDSNQLVVPPWGMSFFAWGGESLIFETFVVPIQYVGQPLYLTVMQGQQWLLQDEDDRVLARGMAGELYESEDGTLKLQTRFLRAHEGTRFKLIRYALANRINQLKGGLKIKESVRGSNILLASYESADRLFAQRMVNAIANAYVRQNIERRAEEAEKSLVFLRDQLPQLKKQAEEAASSFSDFRSREKTLDMSSEISGLMQQSVGIEKGLMEAQMKRKELLERYNPQHPYVRVIDGQIAQLQADSKSLSGQIGLLPKTQQSYLQFARDVEVSNQLYQSLLNYQQQLEVSKAGTVGNVSVIDAAVVPSSPSRPNKILIVALGGLLGLILAVLGTHGYALLAGDVRDPKKLEESMGLKTMAILPRALEQEEAMALQAEQEVAVPFMLAREHPNATSVEAFRSLRVALQFALLNALRQKVVLVTSAVPGQGKSFISANMAYLFASSGKRTLLIDADIRRTSLKKYLPIPPGMGLSEVLQSRAKVDDCFLQNVYPNLDVLPAGLPAKNPGELFTEDKLKEIIFAAARAYDMVIIDSPPVLPVNDAVVMAHLSDVTLFVARQDHVSVHEIEEALELFEKSGSKVDGLVFNSFVPSRLRYGAAAYGYYAYRYGYRGRYSRYHSYHQDGDGSNQKPASIGQAILKDVRQSSREYQTQGFKLLREFLRWLRRRD